MFIDELNVSLIYSLDFSAMQFSLSTTKIFFLQNDRHDFSRSEAMVIEQQVLQSANNSVKLLFRN